MGRVVFGHVTATLMDLEQRGFLGIEEVPGSNGRDWLLVDRRAQSPGCSELLPFEAVLLGGLFARRDQVRLSELTGALVRVLNRVRAELTRDAVRHGRLRRWRRGQRAPDGERLLREIWSFRRGLQALTASGGDEALAGLAPYARVFGIKGPAAVSLPGGEPEPPARCRESGPAWSGSDRFVTAWFGVCSAFVPGRRFPGFGHRLLIGSDGFAHQWSASRSHDGHGSHGHTAAGHDGHAGGHGGFGAGHGGFHGGHAGFNRAWRQCARRARLGAVGGLDRSDGQWTAWCPARTVHAATPGGLRAAIEHAISGDEGD